ncbi:MAG TPA: biotin/lipoyl-binding protein, partial [Rhizobiales bacterium]|nr:biotin/lipoyl-binding protein [Hyphomicrobiales bacterium]
MPIPILMPALSPTMETGNLVKWHVAEGDEVAAGDVIAEIETDKATMEVEAVDEGIIGKILVPAGTNGVSVNSQIALLLEEDEDKSVISESGAPEISAAGEVSEPPAPPPDSPPVAPDPIPAISETAENSNAAPEKANRIFVSPLARRIAAEKGLDLSQIKGSGPHGRIVKADVEHAQPASSPAIEAPPAMAPSDIAALYAPGSFTEEPLNSMRATIARRLTEAKRDVPHYYLSIDCRL